MKIWLALCLALIAFSTRPAGNPPTCSVYFSPHGGCTDAVVRELDRAQSPESSRTK